MATVREHVERRVAGFKGLFRRSIVAEEGDRHYKVGFALRKPIAIDHIKPAFRLVSTRGRTRLHSPVQDSNKVEYFGGRQASSGKPSWILETFANNAVVHVSKTESTLKDLAALSIFLRRLAAEIPVRARRSRK